MLFTILLIVKWLFIGLMALIALLAIATALFLKLAPTFGGRPDAESLARIQSSKNFNGQTFVNLVPTHASTIDIDDVSDGISEVEGHILWQFLFPEKGKNPSKPIISYPLRLTKQPSPDASATTTDPDTATASCLKEGEFVWLGHSTVLFRCAHMTIITDPVFHRASPAPIGGKPFATSATPTVADLPYLDVVLISHDHYDHLDHKAIKQLVAQNKVGHFYVPLGVKAHLLRWGVARDSISEFDWYQHLTLTACRHDAETTPQLEQPPLPVAYEVNDASSAELLANQLRLVFTPTRHFSGRRIRGHRTTLWGSWVVQSQQLNVYFSGDGGYSAEFATIGERFGPFDIAFIEDGAYNERWRDVHMMPEESAQAGFDLRTKVILPIHWGKFDLSTHHWREPVRRIKKAVARGNAALDVEQQIKLTTPRVGEVFDLDNLPAEDWWESYNE